MKTDRINKNEKRLDNITVSVKKLEEALCEFKSNIDDIKLLNKYYGSKQWFKDKDDYENDRMPKIKAGVLSEDAVWNINEDISDIIEEMRSIIKDYSNEDK